MFKAGSSLLSEESLTKAIASADIPEGCQKVAGG